MADDVRGAVQAIVDQFRPGMQADGTDLLLDDIRDDVVYLQLVYGPNACEECVLPPESLAEHLLSFVQESAPGVKNVVVTEQRPDNANA